MAWTSPLTAVAGAALTAAQWNAAVRDNLLETAVAKASQSGSYFVGTGVNSLAERKIQANEVAVSQSTTNTSYADLSTVGPQVTVTTGTRALVLINCDLRSSTAGEFARASVTVSGATSDAASDNRCLKFGSPGAGDSFQAAFAYMATLTAGSNSFKVQYRSSSGTSTYAERRLIVLPF